MAVSDYLKPRILDHVLQLGESDTAQATNLYVALCTSAPNDALTGTTLQSGGTEVAVGTGGYARIACNSWAAASERTATNSAAAMFATLTASIGTITHFAICDHVTAGNMLFWAQLESARTFDTRSTPYFSAGELKVEFNTGYISTYLANELLDHFLKTGAWAQAQRITSSFDFVDGDVVVADDTIAEVAHGLSNGTPVILTSTGTLPAGLALNTIYYVYDATNKIQLHPTRKDAMKNTNKVDITAAAGGGTHTVNLAPRTYVSLYYTNPGDDDSGTEISGTDYARHEVHANGNSGQTADGAAEWAAASGNTVTNTGAVWDGNFVAAPPPNPATWTAGAGGWPQISYIAAHDAVTAGNLLFYWPSTNTATLGAAETFTVASADISISVD
jgi:hypothetical protein